MTGRRKTDETKPIEAVYPNVAEWVEGCGWIEIGDQQWHFLPHRRPDG